MRFKRKFKNYIMYRPIVLIGAGQLGAMILKMWPTDLRRPIMILDSKKTGSIHGVPIHPIDGHKFDPEHIYLLSYFKEDPSVIRALFDEIEQELITVYDLLELFSPDRFSNGWYANSFDFVRIMTTARLFQDSESKAILRHVAHWKFRRKLRDNFVLKDESTKYNLEFVNPHHYTYDYVIDGGSHDLHLYRSADFHNLSFRKYIAIEPDQESPLFNALPERVSQDDRLEIVQKALVGIHAPRKLISNGLLSARLVPGLAADPQNVQVIKFIDLIDSIGISSHSRVLVKLHIEGPEFEVVSDAREILGQWKHIHLMINLSHNLESLIGIPRILHRLGYTLKLECHSLFGEGITLYARM